MELISMQHRYSLFPFFTKKENTDTIHTENKDKGMDTLQQIQILPKSLSVWNTFFVIIHGCKP